MRSYANFYISMLWGTALIAGFIVASDFGFMSINFIIYLVLFSLSNLLSMLVITEKSKEASQNTRRKKQ